MKARKYYVGLGDGMRQAFTTERPVTEANFPQFGAVISGFKTARGAQFAASWRGRNNPHFQTSEDADRIARECVREEGAAWDFLKVPIARL